MQVQPFHLLQPIYGYGQIIISLNEHPDLTLIERIVSLMGIVQGNTTRLPIQSERFKKLRDGINILRISLNQLALQNKGSKVEYMRNFGELIFTIDSSCRNYLQISHLMLYANELLKSPEKPMPLMGQVPEIKKLSIEEGRKVIDALSRRIKSENLLYLDEIPQELKGDRVLSKYRCFLSKDPIRFPLVVHVPGKKAILVDLKVFNTWVGDIPSLNCSADRARHYSYIDNELLRNIDARLLIIRQRMEVRQEMPEISEGMICRASGAVVEYSLRGLSWVADEFSKQSNQLEWIAFKDRKNGQMTKYEIAAEAGAIMSGSIAIAAKVAKVGLFALSSICYFGVTSVFGGSQEPLKRILRTGVLGIEGINAVTQKR